MTIRLVRGAPSLREPTAVRAVEETLRPGCERPHFRLIHYSLQRNHAHFIVEADDASALGRGMGALLIRVARAANRIWGRKGRLFDDRYHVRLLRAPREVHNALAYVLGNGWKHRVAQRAAIDAASSGRWFDGWSVPLTQAADPPAVASARFWLLTFG